MKKHLHTLTAEEYDEMVKDVLERHKDLFEALAPIDILEYDVAQYIITNQEAFREKLKPYVKSQPEMFPPSLYEIYLHQYEAKAFEVILDTVSEVFNLDPEGRLRVPKELIRRIAGDLLTPGKESV